MKVLRWRKGAEAVTKGRDHYQGQTSVALFIASPPVLLLVVTGEFLKAVVVLALSMLFRYLKTACKQQEGAEPYFSFPAEKVGQLILMRKPTALFRGLLFDTYSRQYLGIRFCISGHVCSGAACCAWSWWTPQSIFITSRFLCTSRSTDTNPP